MARVNDPVVWLVVALCSAVGVAAPAVENAQVEGNRNILITSGAATGKPCITPTRAAIEVTDACRQARNLGRGGGMTNGWEFWSPKT